MESRLGLLALMVVVLLSCGVEPYRDLNIDDVPEARLVELFDVEQTDSLFLARPFRGVFGPEGNIYVTDTGPMQIVIFDPLGKRMGTIGRKGEGPGEFNSINGIKFLNDGTLMVYDQGDRKIIHFDSAENGFTYLGERILRMPEGQYPLSVTFTGDGVVYAQYSSFMPPGEKSEDKRDNVYRIGPDGQIDGESLFDVRRLEMVSVQNGDNLINAMKPFANYSVFAGANDSTIYHNWTAESIIYQFGYDGFVIDSFGVAIPRPLVTEVDRAQIAESRSPITSSLVNEIPNEMPATRDMIVDRLGRIWQGYGRRDENRFVVYDADGTPLFKIQGPEGYFITDASANAVLGVNFGEAKATVFMLETETE